jgi:putative endonuclease
MDRKAFGFYGENTAVKYLTKNGYKILEKNFRTIFGEIDIIAKEKDTIVFVEVKTRKSDDFVSPLESVDSKKQKHLIRAGLSYLKSKKIFEKVPCRFDVVSIVSHDSDKNSKIELIKNAFDAN